MSKPPLPKLPDAAARERIETSLDRNVLVEAAAGTGKTTLMVRRILNLVGDRKIKQRLSRIAAITFTEKAAGELKMRLREKLEQGGFSPEVLADLELAQCGTIHGFCAGILHERPVEAGVDPAFQVADALQTELLQEEVWREWIEEQMAAETGAEVLARALYLDIELTAVRELAQALVAQRSRLNRENLPPRRGSGEILREAGAVAESLVKLAASCTDAENDTMMQRMLPLVSVTQAWSSLTPREQEHVLLREVKPAPASGNFNRVGSKKNWSGERFLLDARELMARLAGLRDEAADAFVRELLRWLRGFGDAYEREKQRQGLLDFDDLLLKTRDLLRGNHEVRRDFQKRYDRLLVDEFQDTDPVQTEIVFFLAEKEARAHEWHEVELAPGKLFVVGDPKQSIYRFRGADIEVYHAAQQALAAQGDVEHIKTSFRTASPLVGWVNRVFERLIAPPEKGVAYQPDYVPLAAHPALEASSPRVLVLGLTTEEAAQLAERVGVDELRRMEARAVAQMLLHLHGNAERHVTFRGGDGDLQSRAPLWSDFAVLLRSYTALDLYERVFEAYDIPFLVEGGKDYFQRPEVRAVCSLLLALDNPANKVELVSVLRSPIFGVSDDDLVLWRRVLEQPLDYLQGGTGVPPVHRNKTGKQDAGPAVDTITTAFQLMRELHDGRNNCSYAAFLERCYERLKIPERFLLRPQGEQRVANLYKLVGTARAVQSVEGMSLRGLARHLRDVAIERAEEGQSPTSEMEKGADDAVRMLTIHKAKGLEWGIVTLADMAREGRGGQDMVLPAPATRRPEARLSGLTSAGFTAARDEERKRQEAEERRLLYVACTRARDWFVLPWFGKRGEYTKILAGAFVPQAADDVEPVDRTKLAPLVARGQTMQVGLEEPDARRRPAVEKLVAERAAWMAEREAGRASLFAGVKKVTPSSLGEREYDRDEIDEDGSRRRKEADSGSVEGKPPPHVGGYGKGIERGRGVHEALARCDLRDAEAAAKLYPPGEKLIRTALDHKLMKRVLAADEFHREVPVVWQSPDGLMEGCVDLLFKEGKRLVVVDYKTDSKPDPALYTAQLAAYAKALQAITGLPIAEKLLFFLATGEVMAV
jgi:ATP-dependent helicase/nuclease subunit A